MNSMAALPVFIEQSCRTTQDSALAAQDSKLPLVLDESIVTLSDVYKAKRSVGVSSVNIKISRARGITGAALMRDVMQELNLMVSVEDMWGGDLITAAVSHLAASTRPESLLMTSFMNDWTDGHVAGYRPRSVNGRGSAPAGPGLGIEIDTTFLGEPLVLGAGLGAGSRHPHGSQVGSHQRPTWSHIEPAAPFDSGGLPGIQLQPAISADGRNLVRIEGVRGSNPLSSTKRSSHFTRVHVHIWV